MIHRLALLAAFLFTILIAASAFAAPSAPPPEEGKKTGIARIWRGRTLATKADEYEAYLNASGIAKIRATPGNLGVTLLRRTEGDKTEFLVISIWESIEAVRSFAGADYQKAVILPRDREYLLEVEPNVLHFQIVLEERKTNTRP